MGLTELLLVLAVGGGIVAVLFATFRGAASEGGGRAEQTETVSAERAELEERRQAAMRSLEEIEADREAGNLSAADYEALRRRYGRELAMLEERLAAVAARQPVAAPEGEAGVAAGRRSWLNAVGWSAGAVGFVALAWLAMSQALRPRGADDSITGSLPGEAPGGTAGAPVADVDPDQLAALERVVAADSTNVEALVELGHLYLVLQRYSELTQVTLRALRQDPNNPEALTHLGMLLFSSQHPQGVMESFDRALEIDPDFPEALQFKGMVAFMERDYETAVAAWEHYLAVVPPDRASARIKAMLEMARANAGADSAN